MPISIPPNGGLDCSPWTVCGYRAQPMSGTTDLACSLAADHTYGQLTMNAPVPPWKSARDASSSEVDIDGPATPCLETWLITLAASLPAAVSRPSLSWSACAVGFCTIWPPAPSTSALIHTM